MKCEGYPDCNNPAFIVACKGRKTLHICAICRELPAFRTYKKHIMAARKEHGK